MKYRMLSLVIGMTLCLMSYAQQDYIEYYLMVDAAQYSMRKGAYDDAIRMYESAFGEVEAARGPDYLSMADCFLELGKFVEADAYMSKAIVQGVPMRYIERIREGKDKTETQKNFWRKIEEAYPAMRAQFYANIDVDKYVALQVLKHSDQEIRRHLLSNEFFMKDSLLVAYAGIIDSVNIEHLLGLIEETGDWPGFKSFGDAESGAYYALLHLSPSNFSDSIRYDSIHQYLYEIAKRGVREGEITPFQFAYWVDYNLKSTEGVQLYGVPSYRNWETIPFKDVEGLEARRKEIGLPSLRTVYLREGENLPDWYINGDE